MFQKQRPEVQYSQDLQNSQESNCAGVSTYNFIKKETLPQVFSWKTCEILRTPFLQNISARLVPVRNSCPEVFLGKGVLKICNKFTGEHPRSAISIKLHSNCIEIRLRHGSSHVNLLHIFRAPFTKNTYRWLLLNVYKIRRSQQTLELGYVILAVTS